MNEKDKKNNYKKIAIIAGAALCGLAAGTLVYLSIKENNNLNEEEVKENEQKLFEGNTIEIEDPNEGVGIEDNYVADEDDMNEGMGVEDNYNSGIELEINESDKIENIDELYSKENKVEDTTICTGDTTMFYKLYNEPIPETVKNLDEDIVIRLEELIGRDIDENEVVTDAMKDMIKLIKIEQKYDL